MRRITIISVIILSLFTIKYSFSADFPHSSDNSIYCNDCHNIHSAKGQGLTSYEENESLCISCHKYESDASGKPFDGENVQAVPGVIGISHRWDGEMPPSTNPNNPFGLRATGDIENGALKARLLLFGGKVTCSVCHDQHTQISTAWDPDAEETEGTATGGSTITLVDDTKMWTTNFWSDYEVTVTSGTNYTSTNDYDSTRTIDSNTYNTLTLKSSLNYGIVGGVTYFIQYERHFQRMATVLDSNPANINDLCEDCHYFRSRKAIEDGAVTDVRTWDGKKKSHPMVKNLTTNVTDPTQYVGAAPLESNKNAQIISPRYHGDADGNSTNNKVLDSLSKVRCLTCHGIHYTDSDGSTLDAP